MLRNSTLALVPLAIVVAIVVILSNFRPTGDRKIAPSAQLGGITHTEVSSTSGQHSAPAPAVLKDIGLPIGPFDPVLKVEAPVDALDVVPANPAVSDPTGEQLGIVQSEVTIVVQGDQVAAGWNDGQAFVGGGTVSGYGFSNDRGDTWTDSGSLPNGMNTAVFGDPSLAVTASGTFVFASLNRAGASFDGITLNRGIPAGGNLVFDPAVPFNDTESGALDKEYLEYDPTTGRLYMSFKNLDTRRGRLTFSDDEGVSWSNPITVETGTGPSANGYYPAPGVDGEVYVSWGHPAFLGNANLYLRHSADGGSSWSGSRRLIAQLGPATGTRPQCFNRTFNLNFPSVFVDRSDGPFRGRVYAAYQDGVPGGYNIFVRYSDDKGQTWSDRVQVNDNANMGTTEQFWPQLHVGPNGRATVSFFDRRKSSNQNSLCDYYVAQSVDGGATWVPNRRASNTSVAWCGVPANIAPNFGDYTEMVSDALGVFAIWSDARSGDPDVFMARFDDVQRLAVSGNVAGPFATGTEGTAWFIPNEAELAAPVLFPDGAEAELAVITSALSLLATPAEEQGPFQLGGESLSGSLLMTSSQGNLQGTFSLNRVGPNDITFDVTSASDPALEVLEFEDDFTMTATLADATPGTATIGGQVALRLVGQGDFVLLLSGTIDLDGNPGGNLGGALSIEQSGRLRLDTERFVHTKTFVETGVTTGVPDVRLGSNPPPIALLRSTPNPWLSSSQIRLELSHPTSGVVNIYSVTGRLVRRVAIGPFTAGDHSFAFDGKDEAGTDLPHGGYVLRLDGANVQAAGKLLILR